MTAITDVSTLENVPSDRLLTLPEVAQVLRLSINTLRWWRQNDEGPTFFKIGRNLVITAGDLRSWITEQRNAAGRPSPAA